MDEHEACDECISPRSFEPGVVTCSMDGSIVVAQDFFYSMTDPPHPIAKVDTKNQLASQNKSTYWRPFQIENQHSTTVIPLIIEHHYHDPTTDIAGEHILRKDLDRF